MPRPSSRQTGGLRPLPIPHCPTAAAPPDPASVFSGPRRELQEQRLQFCQTERAATPAHGSRPGDFHDDFHDLRAWSALPVRRARRSRRPFALAVDGIRHGGSANIADIDRLHPGHARRRSEAAWARSAAQRSKPVGEFILGPEYQGGAQDGGRGARPTGTAFFAGSLGASVARGGDFFSSAPIAETCTIRAPRGLGPLGPPFSAPPGLHGVKSLRAALGQNAPRD